MNESDILKMTYEQKTEKLDEILTKLDRSKVPIDEVAEDVKLGAKLIKELDKKLKKVEIEVQNAFKELENSEQPDSS